MPLFGGGEGQDEGEALRAEADRVGALPLPALAAEVMTKGFGSGGPAADAGARLHDIAAAFNPGPGEFGGGDEQTTQRLTEMVGEGLQVLEHASLVRFAFRGGAHPTIEWMATRVGRAALQEGAVDQLVGG